jgi:hypothetical protein
MTVATPEYLDEVLSHDSEYMAMDAKLTTLTEGNETLAPEEREAVVTEAFETVARALVEAANSKDDLIALIAGALYAQMEVASRDIEVAELDAFASGVESENERSMKTIVAIVNRFGSFSLTGADVQAVKQLGGSDALVALTDDSDPETITYSLR